MSSKTSREMIAELVPSQDKLKGTVVPPAEFDDIRIFSNKGLSDYIVERIGLLRKKQEVVPQYTDIKEKITGRLFGFFVNYSVRQQNQLNIRYADVCEEFMRLSAERIELSKQIMEASEKLNKLIEAKKEEE